MNPSSICYLSFREKLETNLEQLSRCVAREGYEITVVNFSSAPQTPQVKPDGRKFFFLDLGDSAHSRGKIKIRIKKLRFILKAIQFLRMKRFSIIHVDTGCPFFWLLKLLYKDSKIIYHIQSYPVSLKKYRLDAFKVLISVFLQSFFVDAVIVQSLEQKGKWIGTGRLKKTKIVPIGFNGEILMPLSKDRRAIVREQKGISTDESVLIYVGAMTKQRRLDRLIHAIGILRNDFPQIKLFMIGNGDDSESLKMLARSMDLNANIIFTGMVDHEEIVKYYGLADIGISYIPINKNYNYNPPLKTYEYLACGLPCVATQTISNMQIIKDKYNGILVSDTAESVANGISALLNDKNLAEMLGNNARKSVIHNDFKVIAHSYLLPIYNRKG